MKMQECKYKEIYDTLKWYRDVTTSRGTSIGDADLFFENAKREICYKCEELNVSIDVRTFFTRKLYKAQYECCKRFNWVASLDAVKSELK